MVNKEKLEEILVANWTKFMDVNKFMAFVLRCAKDINKNSCVVTGELKKNTKVTLSKFTPTPNGFILWADFSVPHGETMAIGTAELFLSPCGEISHIRTVGNLFTN